MAEKELKVKMKYKKSAVTRESVYEAAVALMAERGYAGATIRDICKRANVSPATFYSYYGSKFDVLWDMYRDSNALFRDVVALDVSEKPFPEQLRIFTEHYAKLNIETGIDVMRVLFNPENELFARPRPMQELLFSIFSGAIAQGILPSDRTADELVDKMFVVLRGVCFDWCIRGGTYDLEKAMTEHLEIFLSGLLPR